jgi:LPXTG-site transpeptidase (sortase) family protein
MTRATSSWVLFGLGATLLGYCVALEARALWTHHTMSERLDAIAPQDDAIQGVGADGLADATRNEAETTGLIGRIEIRRVGLSAVVLEGVAERTLSQGVGHMPGSGYPGEDDNVVLAAHRDTYFGALEHVERGDSIWIDTPDGRFGYRVEKTLVVLPDRTDLLADADQGELTLVTCYPFYWVGPAPKRFIVRAEPLERTTYASRTTDPNEARP